MRLLNQRAKYAMQIGELKATMQIPVYSPDREKEILANVERWSEGPLSDAALRRIFERVIDESRRVVRSVAGEDQEEK